MSNLTVIVAFTQNSGDDPATGLTLADIGLYLTAVNVSTGARTVIWNGTQNPTFEVDNAGAYGKIYASADLDTYHYVAGGLYGGATSLDSDWVTGVASSDASEIWAYASRTLTQSAAAVTAAVSGSDLTILRGDTFTAAITGLGSIANRSKLWFTIKASKDDTDEAALVNILLTTPAAGTDGLQTLNGATGTAAQGSIVVDNETTGAITITIDDAATVSLIPQDAVYDIQVLRTTGAVNTLTEGDAEITGDVTRART
jgi:hypothetical protein